MEAAWRQLDASIQAQPMPPEFSQARCFVLCSDCEKKSHSPFHFLGQKCAECGSYNTKIISREGFPAMITTPLPQLAPVEIQYGDDDDDDDDEEEGEEEDEDENEEKKEKTSEEQPPPKTDSN
jgi:hypothetical protein